MCKSPKCFGIQLGWQSQLTITNSITKRKNGKNIGRKNPPFYAIIPVNAVFLPHLREGSQSLILVSLVMNQTGCSLIPNLFIFECYNFTGTSYPLINNILLAGFLWALSSGSLICDHKKGKETGVFGQTISLVYIISFPIQ